MNRPLNPQLQQSLAAFTRANPALALAGTSANPYEGGTYTPCAADRVLLAGGQLASYLKPESIVPLEYVFRRLPIDGIFDALPNRPCQFEMGNIVVPPNMGLVVLDSRFAIYRPSGAAAGDFVELEDNRLPTQVGWDIQAEATRQGNFHYELQPIPPANVSSPGFQSNPNPGFIPGGPPQPATDDQFEAARFTQAQSAVGDALSLMPQRHFRQGLIHVSAPWILHSNQTLIVSCRIFRGIQIPIAFFEAEIFGFFMPDTNLYEMQKAIAPCVTKPGGV